MLDALLIVAAWAFATWVYVWSRAEDRRRRARTSAYDLQSAAWVKAEREKLDREVAVGSLQPFARSLLEIMLQRIEEPTEPKVWGPRR